MGGDDEKKKLVEEVKKKACADGMSPSSVDKKRHLRGDVAKALAKGWNSWSANVSSPVSLHDFKDPEPAGAEAKNTKNTENSMNDRSYMNGIKVSHFIPANTGDKEFAEGILESPASKPKVCCDTKP